MEYGKEVKRGGHFAYEHSHLPPGKSTFFDHDISTSDCNSISHDAVPEVFPHQAEACKGSEAEPSYPPVDPPEDKQHHQVQRQEEALAQDSSRHLDDSPTHPHFRLSIPAHKYTAYTTSTTTSAITEIDFESQ